MPSDSTTSSAPAIRWLGPAPTDAFDAHTPMCEGVLNVRGLDFLVRVYVEVCNPWVVWARATRATDEHGNLLLIPWEAADTKMVGTRTMTDLLDRLRSSVCHLLDRVGVREN